ncbi:BTAD domain-containing putative transcriptional regulator [Streptomyces sp. TRM49041]|uniref:AfsR/SARP family transcriptional regulator n=1 Tax=Streptomyces sp. TRM49041 TaxID=2603216 RepID=UPI0011EFB2D0|nr:BTAD domain-containing putative transcriptional regulator [Streptomyces sp. TRM49041]
MLEVRLLGPAEVWDGDRRIALSGPKPTAILAALVVHAGEVLSTDRLVDLVWEEQAPVTARALVASHVSALRRALAGVSGGGAAIGTRSPGYVAEVPRDRIDVHRFEEALALGRRAAAEGHHAEAADILRDAMTLWRGQDALEGLSQSFARIEAARLAELRRVGLEARFAAELTLGCRAEIVAELYTHVAANPLRERPRGQLMTALFRTGRVPDALRVYHEGRELLGTELGIDPGPELRALHQALLTGDTAVLGTPVPSSTVSTVTGARTSGSGSVDAVPRQSTGGADGDADTGGPPMPCHLPPDVADFVGREAEITWATALLVGAGDPARTAAPMGVVSGRSGVGKTALAVHIGHRLSARFPDGQLFLDLRASDAAPVHTADALARLLRALGVDPDALTGGVEDLVGVYRTHIARRRILLVLDNAVGEAHLRPLLPPGPGSAVLITSRRRLVALEGAAHLDLKAPAEDEALALLTKVAGPGRAETEPGGTAEIVALCGRLPLAVRIAGARLAARPHWTAARLAARLRDERRRLDELQAGDLELRASLELGYAELGEHRRRALRRLALLELPDFAAWVAAPLLDVSPDDAEEAVEILVDCHFIELVGVDETGQTRYRIHDLAREHARERCLSDETEEDRRAAVLRLVDHWLSLAEAAAARAPGGAARLLHERHSGTPLDPLLARDLLSRPAAWFAAEQACLVAAVTHCAEHGLPRAARELAAVLIASSAALYNQFDAWSRSHTAALAAVRRSGDAEGEAWLLDGLGRLRLEQDRFDDAFAYFGDALRLFDETGVARGRAGALTGMGDVRREQGRFTEALDLLRAAAASYQEPVDPAALAHIEYGIGAVYRDRGRYPEAWEALTRSLELYRAADDRQGEGLSLRSLALCHRAQGELPEAESLLRDSLRIFEETGDTFGEMYASQSLAKVQLRQGRIAHARERLERCLDVTRERRDLFGEALVRRSLGETRLAAGDWDGATDELRRALALWDRMGLPLWRARTVRDLGTAAAGRGDEAAARAAWAEALEVFRELGSREAEEMRQQG